MFDNAQINEICWIVSQRNAWAKERKKARNKLYCLKYISRSRDKNEIFDAHLEFANVNARRLSFSKFTTRLRKLLKANSAYLVSDRNAGYKSIVIDVRSSDGSQSISISRDEFEKRAMCYEFDLVISGSLK